MAAQAAIQQAIHNDRHDAGDDHSNHQPGHELPAKREQPDRLGQGDDLNHRKGDVGAHSDKFLARKVRELQYSIAQGQADAATRNDGTPRSEEQTSELKSLMRTSYAVYCLKTKM